MTEHWCVHIVDSDCSRRAAIARELYGQDIHAEIYENLQELNDCSPSRGAVLINDDQMPSHVERPAGLIGSRTGHLPVAFFSESPSLPRIVEAMRSGALDYLQWPFAPEAISDSVVRLARTGEEATRAARRRAEAARLVGKLSMREREVLIGLVRGNTNKETAAALGISPRTVEIHRSNMVARLGARSTGDAIRTGLDAGLTD